MSPEDGSSHLYKQRYGVCHCCGWKGPVSKVGRHDRKRLNIDRAYGRLCSDCAADLLLHRSGASTAGGDRTLKAVNDRDVA